MNKASFLILFFIYLLAPLSESLFAQNPSTNFTITGLGSPTRIALQTSGSKFVTWNVNSQIRMYSTNGTLLCTSIYPQQIQRIIWPTEYYPILLPFPGLEITTMNETDCSPIKTYDIKTLTNNTNSTDEISQITFLWLNGGPYVAFSSMIGIYQIDLNSLSLVNLYATLDTTFPRYQSTTYSKDRKNIYVVMTDASTGVRTVRVWETKTKIGRPVQEITFSTSVSGMTPSSDNTSIICVGSSPTADNSSIYRIDSNGFAKTKATRSGVGKMITIGNGNTVALFQSGKGTMELIRAGDGNTIQNKTFSSSSYALDVDFKNNIMIMLDSSSRVVTYSYTPDEDVQPIPDPVTPGQSFPIWIIIVSVIAGIIVLAVVLMYVFREKLPGGLRKKLPKCFKANQADEKKPLLNENKKQPNVGPANQKDNIPSNVNRNPHPIQYPNHSHHNYPPHNKSEFSEGQKDGIPPGMNDAQIIEQIRKQEQRRQRQQQQRLRLQQQRHRLQQAFEREQRQRKYRIEQQERARRQMQYRRQKEWEDQQRLREIERRRIEQMERERQRQRIRMEEIERIRKEEQARRYYEFQKREEERKRIQIENKRIEDMKRIEYQRFLEEQDRRKYQYQQPYPPYSSNPNMYVQPQPYNPQYYPNSQNPVRDPISQPQSFRKEFVDQRKNLISAPREERPAQMEEGQMNNMPPNNNFFVVKRNDIDVMQQENEYNQEKPEE